MYERIVLILILKKQGRQSRNAFIWFWTKYCLMVTQNIAVINKKKEILIRGNS